MGTSTSSPHGSSGPCNCLSDAAVSPVSSVEAAEPEAVLPSSLPRLRTMGRRSSHLYSPVANDVEARMDTQKSPEVAALIYTSIRKNPNIKKVAPFREEDVQFLVASAWCEEIPKGGEIMQEGSLENSFLFIVASGGFEIASSDPYQVTGVDDMFYLTRSAHHLQEEPTSPVRQGSKAVRSSSKILHRVGPKTCFGDSSLMYNSPRWCTATASEPTAVWVISQANFRAAQLQVKQALATQKSADDITLIRQSILLNDNLQRLTPLTGDHADELVKLAWANEFKAGDCIMGEGDLNADNLYIVAKGSVEFTANEPFKLVTHGDVSFLARPMRTIAMVDVQSVTSNFDKFGRGLMFGEMSMLYCAPRMATVTAIEDVVLWAIDRASFQMVQVKAAQDEVRDRVRHLEDVPAMKAFSKPDKDKVAVVMETMRFGPGEELVSQGSAPKAMYILLEGSVERIVDGVVQQRLTADPDERVSHRFAEEVLHTEEPKPYPATVRVESSSTTVLTLARTEFLKVWDRLLEAAPAPTFERFMTSVTKMNAGDGAHSFEMRNMTPLGLLGVGYLGPIELYRHKKTKEFYAVKKMNKGLVTHMGLCGSVVRERILWQETLSPFIVRLDAAHREAQTLIFVLEFPAGGELQMAYALHKLHGQEPVARHIVAGIVLAFTHLHKRKIIFRNLKPQNVLLSATGQPKITDFSIACKVNSFTFTTCGTPTYMAPEILTGSGHNRAVDWWSLGILMFWMTAGYTPFDSEHPMDIYAKALRGIARVEWPEGVTGPLQDLIFSSLQPIAIDRLAMHQGGSQNVMDHPWFNDFKWDPMRTGTMEAPFVPKFAVSPNQWRDLPDDSSTFAAKYTPNSETLPTTVPCDEFTDWDDDFPTA